MTDIRPIREPEAEPFLELLCEVFGLDFNRAHDIFFSEPLFDIQRKWALFEGNEMVSILTTTLLQFGWGKAVGIAGVATRQKMRSEGHASKLLQRVLAESEHRGEGAALLFANQTGVYDQNGFEPLDRVVRAPVVVAVEEGGPHHHLESPQIEEIYQQWCAQDPNRLVRDAQRWKYWRWHYRVCSPFQNGYLCVEPGIIREAVFDEPVSSLPVPRETEWFGLTQMADLLEIPLTNPVVELYLMGYKVPGVPQIFMTDQF